MEGPVGVFICLKLGDVVVVRGKARDGRVFSRYTVCLIPTATSSLPETGLACLQAGRPGQCGKMGEMGEVGSRVVGADQGQRPAYFDYGAYG